MQQSVSVTVHIARETSVQEVSKVFQGLYDLERSGTIQLCFKPDMGKHAHPRVIRLTIADPSAERNIAVDVADQRHIVSSLDLEEVDLYFKRSFWPPNLKRLAPKLRAKVLPFGLNNPAISLGAAARVIPALIPTGRGGLGFARAFKQLLALPHPRAFECPPDDRPDPIVLFQTRVWPPADDDPTVTALNEDRANLVRTLRHNFGHRYVGGLMPDAISLSRYPDLITPTPLKLRTYHNLIKKALVGVYTRGLHRSVAFKLSEYLAASRCIVGHSPEAVLPSPLIQELNYLEFRDHDECVAHCHKLLCNPQMAFEMRRANWEYYCNNVRPMSQMQSVIQKTLRT